MALNASNSGSAYQTTRSLTSLKSKTIVVDTLVAENIISDVVDDSAPPDVPTVVNYSVDFFLMQLELKITGSVYNPPYPTYDSIFNPGSFVASLNDVSGIENGMLAATDYTKAFVFRLPGLCTQITMTAQMKPIAPPVTTAAFTLGVASPTGGTFYSGTSQLVAPPLGSTPLNTVVCRFTFDTPLPANEPFLLFFSNTTVVLNYEFCNLLFNATMQLSETVLVPSSSSSSLNANIVDSQQIQTLIGRLERKDRVQGFVLPQDAENHSCSIGRLAVRNLFARRLVAGSLDFRRGVDFIVPRGEEASLVNKALPDNLGQYYHLASLDQSDTITSLAITAYVETGNPNLQGSYPSLTGTFTVPYRITGIKVYIFYYNGNPDTLIDLTPVSLYVTNSATLVDYPGVVAPVAFDVGVYNDTRTSSGGYTLDTPLEASEPFLIRVSKSSGTAGAINPQFVVIYATLPTV